MEEIKFYGDILKLRAHLYPDHMFDFGELYALGISAS